MTPVARAVMAFTLSGVIGVVGCKKDETEAPAEQPAKEQAAASESEPAAAGEAAGAQPETPAGAMAKLAKAGEALAKAQAQAAGGKATGPVVNWRELAPFLPESVGDFAAAGDVDGSTSGMGGMKVTKVSRRYKAGEQRLRVQIVDTNLMPMMRAGIAMAAQVSEDSSKGVKKGIKIDGNPGLMEWRKSSQRGKVTVLAGSRYLVEVRLKPTDSPDAALAVAKQLDLGKLAKLQPKAE